MKNSYIRKTLEVDWNRVLLEDKSPIAIVIMNLFPNNEFYITSELPDNKFMIMPHNLSAEILITEQDIENFFIVKPESTKSNWTEWKLISELGSICPTIKSYYRGINKLEYRTNMKRIELRSRSNGIKVKASCSPNDVFNIRTGVSIVLVRYFKKIFDKTLCELTAKEGLLIG